MPHVSPLVIVTETEGPGSRLAERLGESGARVWRFPVVAHESAGDEGPLDSALGRLRDYSWVVFTSVRAVEAVCARPAWQQWPWPDGERPFVAAVGPVTAAALRRRGVNVRVTPQDPGAAGLAQALIETEGENLAGQRVLWPRSDIARDELREALVAAGAMLVDPVAYRTVAVRPPDADACGLAMADGEVAAVTFLSPSSVVNFAAALGRTSLADIAGVVMASVGPTTTAALASLGAAPSVEASDRTAAGLAAALLSHLGLPPGAPQGGR